MLAALVHRGPDETGLLAEDQAVMGTARLAIRGLNDGRQPLQDTATGVLAVCNGEIDNHGELRCWLAARGRPVPQAVDVAVVPGLYLELGEAFVDQLVGAFALAVWDPRTRRLILARDRAGERSLFYTVQEDTVVFATELAALAGDDRRALAVSRQDVVAYLETGCFMAPSSPLVGVQKVGPAEVCVLEPDRRHRRQYWRWNIVETAKRPPSVEEFDEVFRRAVHRQSEVEVEYGLFLSGGVDSSLVAAVTRDLRPGHVLHGYTIRFHEPSYDEGAAAGLTARTLGLPLTEIWVGPEQVPGEIARLVRLVGEPVADQSWLPTALLSRRVAQQAKLALVGEGADELFGGYPTYLGARFGDAYARCPAPARRLIRAVIERWPASDKKVTLSSLLKRFVQGAELDGLVRHRLWTAAVPPALRARLGVATTGGSPAATTGELLDLVQRYDFEGSLAEGLLIEKDRGSMSAALELRTPFLDRGVMEFAAALPVAERVRGLTTKVFLKRYAERYLPRAIIHRRKRGLTVPFGSWLRGPLREWAEHRLSGDQLDQAGIDTRVARALLAEHAQRQADHAKALWALIVLSEWLEWLREGQPAATREPAVLRLTRAADASSRQANFKARPYAGSTSP
jgi:asparagine synthase (glutamine-hydrolysing)